MSQEIVHTLKLQLDWGLIKFVSQLDRFDAAWTAIEKREGRTLKELKSIATVRSVGASTRIEGSKMSDEEVDVLLKNIDISKIQDRDKQEVVGYFEVLDLISESYEEIPVSDSGIKGLHNLLMRHSEKDQWHKGDYKKLSNSVEANLPDGTKQIIFETTAPGFATDGAMRAMFDWHDSEQEVHPLIRCAIFSYEFVSIHPFQDGNGRLSRLIATLLLRKCGYQWIQYVSLEHEIEHTKNEYYRVLRACQSNRPGEDVTDWVQYFLKALINVTESLMNKLEKHGVEKSLATRTNNILKLIEVYPGIKTGDIATKLDLSSATVKRELKILIDQKLIIKEGTGPGTNYTII
ncbi:Fic family protein [Sphingobacterium sp. LRF_L2]|uniref:Fic family protein n=1 Tax=Sphingobacterium sp. LRF_L2 TaxID=3369421 RepID=UPI003F632AB3